jgi:DNA-binding NarL/FixJ family response regulator
MSRVIALVDDLLFLTRIQEAARRADVEVLCVREAKGLAEAVRAGGRLVLVDADASRLPWEQALRELRSGSPPAGPRAVAFLSHVHAERAAAARAAGCDRVLARSAFVEELPRLLASVSAPVAAIEEKKR